VLPLLINLLLIPHLERSVGLYLWGVIVVTWFQWWEVENWIHLDQDMDKRWDLVNAVMNLSGSISMGNFVISSSSTIFYVLLFYILYPIGLMMYD
jgi:hypothetical protein